MSASGVADDAARDRGASVPCGTAAAPGGSPPSSRNIQKQEISMSIRRFSPTAWLAAVPAFLLTAGCGNDVVTEPGFPPPPEAVASMQEPPPIDVVFVTGRHLFTDAVAVQVRDKPDGRPTTVSNLQDASRMAVARITVQPGARFPWHTHPGPVLVAVTEGTLVYVYADDCVERTYPRGTAFSDPGFGNVHYAFNPTGGETVIVATFLGVPATGPVTLPVDAATSAALDAKCGVAAASMHSH
jgi:mannose-6-phosphate isomerase-like protein (cupin superfamily)